MEWLWDCQSVWSQAADHAKRAIRRARVTALALGASAAAAGTAASQVLTWHDGLGRALSFLAAVLVGLVPLATRSTGPQQIRDWTRMRSLSEELKSEAYMYLAGVTPYRGADAPQVLLDRAERLLMHGADLAARTRTVEPRQRALPAVTDVRSYMDLRVVGQIERYYRPRAAVMSRRSSQFRTVELALVGSATVLGAASGAYGADWAAAWVATVTTVSAAVIAHAEASRYAYQEIEFSRTAAELELIHRRHATESGPADDDAVVTQCEQVISVQNEGWMTKWLSEY